MQELKDNELKTETAEIVKEPAAADPPTIEQLEAELRYENGKRSFRTSLRSNLHILITIVALAALAATLLIPIYKVKGGSMSPALSDGDIVLVINGSSFETGDIVAFYHNNQILLKRAIAGPGDTIDITEDGRVTINGEIIDEPYVTAAALGDGDMPLPYSVPEREWFVMGDNRENVMDSRTVSIGSIDEDRIVGRAVIRLWPIESLSLLA